MSAEQELALHLVGAHERRRDQAGRIAALAARCDETELLGVLSRQRVLALAGTRLSAAAPDSVSPAFRDAVDEAHQIATRAALIFETAGLAAVATLGEQGVPALPLKGVVLAERAHGDAGLRSTPQDLDLLVSRTDLRSAIARLEALGYGSPVDVAWRDGLPLLHYSLPPRSAWLPPLELHWRTHWDGQDFAEALLRRSAPDLRHGRLALPEWELAALLLFYARDSLAGLRLLADVAGWWDRHAAELPPDGIGSICDAHPALARPLRCAALAAERLAGVPSATVLGTAATATRRDTLALRLADWSQSSGAGADFATNVALVEFLLTPPRALGGFLRRNMFQPAAVFAERYGVREGARLEPRLRQAVQGSARLVRYAARFARAVWHAHRAQPGRSTA